MTSISRGRSEYTSSHGSLTLDNGKNVMKHPCLSSDRINERDAEIRTPAKHVGRGHPGTIPVRWRFSTLPSGHWRHWKDCAFSVRPDGDSQKPSGAPPEAESHSLWIRSLRIRSGRS